MEIREWAERVFGADRMENKLFVPPGGLKALTDHNPGKAVLWRQPPRPANLQIAPKGQRKRIPHVKSLGHQDMRARCLHAFANHELMALEMMAWALLAFPQTEPTFRKGLAKILLDEQQHFQLYCDRLKAMNVSFGDLPLNDHFWRSGEHIRHPLEWVATMHLTFEQSNLDHAPYFAQHFRQVDDEPSAQLMEKIFHDEIHHVRFGSHWLKRYQPEGSSLFQTYLANCTHGNPPERAKGIEFYAEGRRQAGLDEDFIERLKTYTPDASTF